MMVFVLQDVPIYFDFQMELLRSKEYWEWRNKGKLKGFGTTDIEILKEGSPEINNYDIKEICPVGTVEFCVSWFEKYHNKTPKPINVPKELQYGHWSGRKVMDLNLPEDYYTYIVDNPSFKDKFYIKSNGKIKSSLNGSYSDTNSILENFEGSFQISSFMNEIISEWRVFVYNKEIIDIKNYSGDPFVPPLKCRVVEMIKAYKSSPISYTLDIITSSSKYISNASNVLEVHDFFSCGLYGFSDYEKYPFMLYRWFKEFINKE